MDFRKVDLKKLIVPPLVKKDKGNLSCIPLYDNGDGTNSVLCIQTPVCRFPFGYSQDVSDDGRTRCSINGEFTDYRNNPLMKDFYNFCNQLQEYTIALAAHNSKTWFGEKQEAAVCKALMNKWIKVSKDEEKAAKYDPTFKAAIRLRKDGTSWCSSKGPDGEPIELSSISPGSRGIMKLKFSSIYVINGKFGFTFDAQWVRVTEFSSNGPRADDFVPDMYGEAVAPAIPAMIEQETDIYAAKAGVKREADEERVTKAPPKRAKATPATGN